MGLWILDVLFALVSEIVDELLGVFNARFVSENCHSDVITNSAQTDSKAELANAWDKIELANSRMSVPLELYLGCHQVRENQSVFI